MSDLEALQEEAGKSSPYVDGDDTAAENAVAGEEIPEEQAGGVVQADEPPELPDALQSILSDVNEPSNPLFIPSQEGNTKPPRKRGRSQEGILRRDGKHPITHLHVRSCSCSRPTECRAIMWRWAALNAKNMFPYLRLPNYPKNCETPNAAHVIQFREVVCHHLYGYKSSNDLIKGICQRDWIALHHFPAAIRPYVFAGDEGAKKVYKWRVPLEVGKECGLGNRDLCKTLDAEGNKTYMCAPTVTFAQSHAEIDEAERMHGIRQSATNPSADATASTSSSGRKYPNDLKPPKNCKIRKTPKERELDRITRETEANPRAAALKIYDLTEEVERLRQLVADR